MLEEENSAALICDYQLSGVYMMKKEKVYKNISEGQTWSNGMTTWKINTFLLGIDQMVLRDNLMH